MRKKNMTQAATGQKKRGKNPTPKQARALAGMSQRELARRVPCTQATVNRVEQLGRFPRTPAVRAAYLKALGLIEQPNGRLVLGATTAPVPEGGAP